MAREISYGIELEYLAKYLKSEGNEDTKRQHLFPLFKKLYKDKFITESAAAGADIYIEGQLIVECKTDFTQWTEAFYQALHYQKKYGFCL